MTAPELKKQVRSAEPCIIVGSYENLQSMKNEELPPFKSWCWMKMQNCKIRLRKYPRISKRLCEAQQDQNPWGDGTPMENKFEELLTLLDIVNPENLNPRLLRGCRH